MSRIVHWKLQTGGREDQETLEQKRQAGLEYIKKLGDEVIRYTETDGKFVIELKDVDI